MLSIRRELKPRTAPFIDIKTWSQCHHKYRAFVEFLHLLKITYNKNNIVATYIYAACQRAAYKCRNGNCPLGPYKTMSSYGKCNSSSNSSSCETCRRTFGGQRALWLAGHWNGFALRPDAVATQLATGTSLWYSMYSAVYSIMSSVIILRILVLAADTDTNKLRAHAATRQRQRQEGDAAAEEEEETAPHRQRRMCLWIFDLWLQCSDVRFFHALAT